MEGDDEEDGDEGMLAGVPAMKQSNLRRQVLEEMHLPCNSTTPRKVNQLLSSMHFAELIVTAETGLMRLLLESLQTCHLFGGVVVVDDMTYVTCLLFVQSACLQIFITEGV